MYVLLYVVVNVVDMGHLLAIHRGSNDFYWHCTCLLAKHTRDTHFFVVAFLVLAALFMNVGKRLHMGMGSQAHALRTFGESRGIWSFAYGAVGELGPSQELLTSPMLRHIGTAHDRKLTKQVALWWPFQSWAALLVWPTTAFGLGMSSCEPGGPCEDGIKDRASSFDWSLTAKAMAELDAMTSPNDNPALFSSSGCPGAFAMPNKWFFVALEKSIYYF